jgi:hypothetical protein
MSPFPLTLLLIVTPCVLKPLPLLKPHCYGLNLGITFLPFLLPSYLPCVTQSPLCYWGILSQLWNWSYLKQFCSLCWQHWNFSWFDLCPVFSTSCGSHFGAIGTEFFFFFFDKSANFLCFLNTVLYTVFLHVLKIWLSIIHLTYKKSTYC